MLTSEIRDIVTEDSKALFNNHPALQYAEPSVWLNTIIFNALKMRKTFFSNWDYANVMYAMFSNHSSTILKLFILCLQYFS